VKRSLTKISQNQGSADLSGKQALLIVSLNADFRAFGAARLRPGMSTRLGIRQPDSSGLGLARASWLHLPLQLQEGYLLTIAADVSFGTQSAENRCE
jgi:hypothetical protein